MNIHFIKYQETNWKKSTISFEAKYQECIPAIKKCTKLWLSYLHSDTKQTPKDTL